MKRRCMDSVLFIEFHGVLNNYRIILINFTWSRFQKAIFVLVINKNWIGQKNTICIKFNPVKSGSRPLKHLANLKGMYFFGRVTKVSGFNKTEWTKSTPLLSSDKCSINTQTYPCKEFLNHLVFLTHSLPGLLSEQHDVTTDWLSSNTDQVVCRTENRLKFDWYLFTINHLL